MFEFIVKQQKLAQIFTIILIASGLLALYNIQKDKFPKADFDILIIMTTYPNSSPQDVEGKITIPLEDEIKNIDDIESFESVSKENFSKIVIKINQEASDPEQVKQNIRTVISSVDLPDEATTPRVHQIKISETEVLRIGINGNISDQKLANQVDYLQEKLEDVKGVARISQYGDLDDEIKIYLNPDKLKQHKLSLAKVIYTIKNRNYRYTAGNNNSLEDSANIVVLANFNKIDDVKNIILKSNFEGIAVKLKDIATIIKAKKERKNIIKLNGNSGYVLFIFKSSTADIIETVDRIKESVDVFKQAQPKLNIFYANDFSKEVRNSLSIVKNNGIIGFVMVFIVLGIFLSIRSAFWVALGMSSTLLGTVALLWFFGETINLLSLIAMVVVMGIVVDDSIIIAESIVDAKSKDNSYAGVVKGLKRVIKPVLTTVLTSIIAISSMFLMQGTMGKVVYLIPLVVIFALSLSLLEVVIALPAHLANGKSDKGRVWFKSVEKIYLKFVAIMLKIRYLVLFGFIAIAIGTVIFAMNNVGFVLFPAKGSNTITINIETAIGSSLYKTEQITNQLEKVIQDTMGDELDFFSSTIGTDKDNKAKILVKLIASNNIGRTPAVEIVEKLRENSKNIAGITHIDFLVARPGPPKAQDVSLVLVGKNDKQRVAASDKVVQILQKIAGVSDIYRDDNAGKERREVMIDFAKMARLGIDFSSVQNYLRSAFSGIKITSMRQNGKDVDYRIFIGKNNQKMDILGKISIANNKNYLIPITDFVTIKKIIGESDFNHFNGERSITIRASIDDKKNNSVSVKKMTFEQLAIADNFPNIKILSEGGSKDNDKSMQSFKQAFLMSIVVIFLLLTLLFNSYTQPLVVLSAVPFSLVGVIWAFYFHSETLSFFALIGGLALIGVIVNDSLVMVSHLNDIKNNATNDLRSWIARGSADRLRAVTLTSITTIVGVAPLVYGIGGTDLMLQPIVLALGYGLLFGTLVTLILLPCLYMINIEVVAFFSRISIFKRTNKTLTK